MYKCLECGHIFDDGEEKKWTEGYGEELIGCPICSGTFAEAKTCIICGSEYLDEELWNGVCHDCVNDCKKDFEKVYELAKDEKVAVKINSLLASLLTPTEIERILYHHILATGEETDCSEFIESDVEWFTEQLADSVTKGGAIKA